MPRHSQRFAQQREVAAVGVDVHQVRIERADAQDVSHGRPPPREATCSGVSGMWRSSSASSPCSAASSASPPGRDDLQADHVVERLALAVGADHLADALDQHVVVEHADRDRLGDVGPAVDLGRDRAPGAAARRRRARGRWRSRPPARPPGTSARLAAAKKPAAVGQQLDRLHRDRDQPDAAREREVGGVGGRAWRPRRPPGARARAAPRAARGRGRARSRRGRPAASASATRPVPAPTSSTPSVASSASSCQSGRSAS